MTSEPTDRVDQFKAEIAEMKLKTGRTRTDRTFEIVGAVLMVAGIVIAFGAYAASLNVKAAPAGNIDVLNSNSYIALAIAGLAVSVMGGFVFLRYSLARFLRFWLLRQTYEQRVAIDEAAAVREG
jgi:uncharacterized membrane protein YidH (DUF202 family)